MVNLKDNIRRFRKKQKIAYPRTIYYQVWKLLLYNIAIGNNRGIYFMNSRVIRFFADNHRTSSQSMVLSLLKTLQSLKEILF